MILLIVFTVFQTLNDENESSTFSEKSMYDLVLFSKVEYQCEGFLEKNKDTVNEEQINVLKNSKVIVHYIFHFLVLPLPLC